MTLHPSVSGFDSAAEEYERGRPTYPPRAVAWLVEALGIGPGRTVVDLAAGTGKLTRLLTPTGAEIHAVEPVTGMRDQLITLVPGATIHDGTAESMPFADSTVDAVVVGQAFHWFRANEALSEIHRVLRHPGRLGLIWNRRDLSQPGEAELDEIIDRYRGDSPSHASGAWKEAFASTELFGDLVVAQFPFVQVLDADGLLDRVMSISFMAKLGDSDRRQVAGDLAGITRQLGEPAVLHYTTDCYWCEAR